MLKTALHRRQRTRMPIALHLVHFSLTVANDPDNDKQWCTRTEKRGLKQPLESRRQKTMFDGGKPPACHHGSNLPSSPGSAWERTARQALPAVLETIDEPQPLPHFRNRVSLLHDQHHRRLAPGFRIPAVHENRARLLAISPAGAPRRD